MPCGCDYLQIQYKKPTTIDMEIVNVRITDCDEYTPYLNFVKGNKENN